MITERSDVMWYDMIWCDMIWCDMIWYDVMWYDVIWYDVIWYDMIWCDVICLDETRLIPEEVFKFKNPSCQGKSNLVCVKSVYTNSYIRGSAGEYSNSCSGSSCISSTSSRYKIMSGNFS